MTMESGKMSGKVYINDSLIKMRDRLRQNYEDLHRDQIADPDAEVPPVVPAESAQAPQQPRAEVAPERRLPSIRRAGAESPGERERRELEGRIIHDLAETECEIGLLKNKLSELEKFRDVLQKEHDLLLKMAETGDDARLSAIRNEYFAAGGRRQAFVGEHGGASERAAAEAAPASDRWQAMLIAGAVLAGSIIVALVMVGLFGR